MPAAATRTAATAIVWLRWAELAELRRFEHFWTVKYVNSQESTPEGRHYSGVGGESAAVILV